MLQIAKHPEEVDNLILHDATFSPQEVVFRDGQVCIEGIERWMWEEAVTTEEGKIEMPRTWAELTIENALHLRVDYDTYAPLIQDVTILWLECDESAIVRVFRDREEKTVHDIRILGFPANYTVSVEGIEVRLEDVEQEMEVVDLNDVEERDWQMFLKRFEQPTGYRAETEYKKSRFAVGDRVRWGEKSWKVKAVYPSYIGETDAEHTFYYKLEDRGNRFYEHDLEAEESET